MRDKELYLLVESGPILDACRAWRERYWTARTAVFEFAKSFGASSYFGGFNNELLALPHVSPVPEGWRVMKTNRRMIPIKGKAGEAAREAIAALPVFPKHQEIADLIGCPCGISYEQKGVITGSSSVGRFVNPVQLFWPTGAGPMMILAPDMAAAVAKVEADYPEATITQGRWVIPEGLRIISEARKDLIIAEANVAAEEARA